MLVWHQPVVNRGVVNTSLPTVAVDIALDYRQCAVAKLGKSSIWDKVPEGSTLIFKNTLISLKHSVP